MFTTSARKANGSATAQAAASNARTKAWSYAPKPIARISGNDDGARQQLQRQLASLDRQLAKLRDHLKAPGVYEEARIATEERHKVEEELQRLSKKLPE